MSESASELFSGHEDTTTNVSSKETGPPHPPFSSLSNCRDGTAIVLPLDTRPHTQKVNRIVVCFVSFLCTRGEFEAEELIIYAERRENFPFSDRVAEQTERQWTQKETLCVCLPVKCFFCLIYRLSRQWIAFDGRLPLALELGGRQTGGKRLRAAQKQKISAGKVVEWVRGSEKASNWAGNFRKSQKLPQRSRNGQKRLRRQFWGVRKNFLGRKKMRQSC